MALTVERTLAGCAWIARPETAVSLSAHSAPGRARLACGLILSLAIVSGGIALAFAAAGAWPVLPFAGLEILALWLAFLHLARHADDEERIEIDATRLLICRRSGGRSEVSEFSRHWVSLRVESDGDGGCRVFVRAHGREAELGRTASVAQRRRLARELRAALAAADHPATDHAIRHPDTEDPRQ